MQKSELIGAKKDSADTSLKQVNLAVIGCGYWGPKLVRNFSQLKDVKIHSLCDLEMFKACTTANEYASDAKMIADYHIVLNSPEVHCVVIATPAKNHFQIAKDALIAGKHIFVEKPLAMSVQECHELINLASKKNSIIMVGHVFRYNTAVQKIKEYINDGLLGDILYINSRRLNLGRIQTDINSMWSFAPHDISILLYWLDEKPVKVTAKGFSYLNHGVEDDVFMTMEFKSGIKTHSHLSWLNPTKVREVTIMGSKKMLVYDDVTASSKIQIYDRNENLQKDLLLQSERSYAEFQTKTLSGNVNIPYLQFTEPLQTECQHFIDCIRFNSSPITDGKEGLDVVSVLEAAQRSLNNGSISMEVI